MSKKCIFFDVDGVVVHSKLFSEQYQEKYGISNDTMLPFFTGIFQKCLVGEANLKEVIQPYLPQWKWAKSTEDFLQFWFESEHNIDEKVVAYVKELQEKGVTCIVATNQEKYRTEYMKNEMGFSTIFDSVFSSADVGAIKPEQEFFKRIYNAVHDLYGFTKKDILFTDDSQKNVDGGNQFGIQSHFYTGLDEFKKEVDTFLNK